MTITGYIAYCIVVAAQLSMLGIATDLMGGHAGRTGVSAVVFAGIAGYIYAILTTKLGYPPWWSAGLALSCCIVVGALAAPALVSLRGESFLLGTLALQLCLMEVANNVSALGGALGLPAVPALDLPMVRDGAVTAQMFTLPLIAFGVATVINRILRNSGSFGRALHWARDDPAFAQAAGFNVLRIHSKALIVHAGVSAVAGISIAALQGYVSPSSFGLWLSIEVLTVVFLSGTGGNAYAIFAGAALLVAIQEVTRSVALVPSAVGPLQQIVINAALIGILSFWRRGLFGPILGPGPSAERLE